MGRRRKPNYYTRKLARELHRLRHAANLTQVQAAQALDFSNQKLSRIETGQRPGIHELRAMLDLYGLLVSDWETYIDLWRWANQQEWWHGLGLHDITYLDMEDKATTIRDFQTTRLPALLQTEDHARSLLQTSAAPPSRQHEGKELIAHTFRQQLLDGDDPLTLHALIYQPILHAGVDQPQLRHLLQRCEQSNITIQIVPQPAHPLGMLRGSFALLSFPDKEETDLACTEHPLGFTYTQEPEPVDALNRTFKALAKLAMSPADSHAYIKNLIT
jgi:transcriptional regulator with XRE-family HTH domain